MNPTRIATTALLGLALASPSAFANLVTNGGFETSVVSAATGYEVRHTADVGWGWDTNARGAVQFNSTYQVGNLQTIGQGLQSIQLELAGDYISQSIATTVGQHYILSFLLSSFEPPGVDSLRVFIDATSYDFSGNNSWTSHSIAFTATSGATTLRFVNNNTSAGFTYPHLDAINVEVPVAPTLPLVGLALASLAWTRRQRMRRVG